MSRRIGIALDLERLDDVKVVPVGDDPDASLLVLRTTESTTTIGLRTDDLWVISSACREAVLRAEARRLAERSAA